jgi:pyridoxamine 5'-phosphate oxidase-like protein
MTLLAPVGGLDRRYSNERATPTPSGRARTELETATSYWLSMVRPDARPHATTIAAVWLEGALHFTTGRRERKAKNLARSAWCSVTAGYRGLKGLDVVVEGKAMRVATAPARRRRAEAYRGKYGRLFRYEARDGDLYHQGTVDRVLAYRLRAKQALGVGKGGRLSETRWRLLGTPVRSRSSRSRRC